jgi:anti-anti-sigma factor
VAWRVRLALHLSARRPRRPAGGRYRGDSRGGAQHFGVGRGGRTHRGAVGEADATTAAELRQTLATQLDTGARLVTVDASGLSFLDSASLRVLILAARALRGRHGRLVLARPQPLVARLLEITGADRLLDVRELCGLAAVTPCPGRMRRAGPDRRRVVSAAWETRRCRLSA